MARNRSPQTQEKRRRELDKQMQRQQKMARRLERNAAKKQARESGNHPGIPTIDPPREPTAGVIQKPPIPVETKP